MAAREPQKQARPGYRIDKKGREVRIGYRIDALGEEVPDLRGRKASPLSRRTGIPTSVSASEAEQLEELCEQLGVKRSIVMYHFFLSGIEQLRAGKTKPHPRTSTAKRPVVYILAPRGASSEWDRQQQGQMAANAAIEVWRMGAACICPHLNSGPLQGGVPAEVMRSSHLELVRRCDAVLLLKGWEDSEEAAVEKLEADAAGLPQFNSNAKLLLWLNGRTKKKGEKGKDDALKAG